MGLDVVLATAATLATTPAVSRLEGGDKTVAVAATHRNSVGERCCAR